jgi:hypothetical protein
MPGNENADCAKKSQAPSQTGATDSQLLCQLALRRYAISWTQLAFLNHHPHLIHDLFTH